MNKREDVRQELKDLWKMLFAQPVPQSAGLVGLLLAVITLVASFFTDPSIFIVGTGLVLLWLSGRAVWLVHTCKKMGLVEPVREVACFPVLKASLHWVLVAVFASSLLIIGGLLLATGLVRVYFPQCPDQDQGAFATGTVEGWQIRFEGDRRLGEALEFVRVSCRGRQVDSLEYEFLLGGEYDAGQIGLDGRGVPLVAGMQAWVYSAKDNPRTLAVQCFLMQGPEQGWTWHETVPVKLTPGQWRKIDCPASIYTPSGWVNPPQFIGLMFSDTTGESYLGSVNLAAPSIR